MPPALIGRLAERHALLYRCRSSSAPVASQRRSSRRRSRLAVTASRDNHRDEDFGRRRTPARRGATCRAASYITTSRSWSANPSGVSAGAVNSRAGQGSIELGDVDRSDVSRCRTGEDMGQFSASPINKAVRSFTNTLRRVRER